MKKSSDQGGGFWEDFSEWMDSSEGIESMDVLDYVFNALDGARVNLSEKKIIWPDDQSLSIEQSVQRIEKDSGLDKHKILSHIISWLQMEYVPEGLDKVQMEQFENQIDSWIKKYGSKFP